MAYLRHNRNLGLSARSNKEIDHPEEVFRRAQDREGHAFHQRAVHKQRRGSDPKATIDIALATSPSGKAAYGAVVKSPGGRVELSGSPGTTERQTRPCSLQRLVYGLYSLATTLLCMSCRTTSSRT